MTNEYKYKFASIILAAGKGTRLRSSLDKVMHQVAGIPMIGHVVSTLSALKPEKTVVVVAPHMDSVKATAAAYGPCSFAMQDKQQGTGHAVLCAERELANYHDPILILCGDTPLITAPTLARVLDAMQSADLVVVGMHAADPTGYGRLIIDSSGQLEEIVEHRDTTPEQQAVTLCNAGIMAVKGKHLFSLLKSIQPNNAAGEYYLTDIVSLADEHKLHCQVVVADELEMKGINTKMHLAEAEQVLQARLRLRAMEEGVTLVDPFSIYFSADTKLGRDVVVHPQVVFGPGVTVGDGVEIRSFSHIEGAVIEKNAIIGPYARLRPGSQIGEGAHVGNFVELKKTKLGKGAKANHLSYVGDAEVGAGANIGAGTITCNYDGTNKFNTIIGEGAFIGSNTSLVAPVTVGSGAIVGAGSVITEDVEADALAVARAPQVNRQAKAKEIRQRQKKA